MELPLKLEALLFATGDPLSTKDCMRLLEIDAPTLEHTISELKTTLEGRGIRLMHHDNTLTLTTAPEAAPLVEQIAKEQLEGNLSRSALETLAVILWQGKASRSAVDYIRGVNSAFAIRTLLLRGLIERSQDPTDARVFTYSPTMELLKYLGISSLDELPELETIKKQLQEAYKETTHDEQ